jgi:hypothetical protein
MTTSLLQVAASLTSGELVRRVKRLANNERAATAELIAHLAEFDTRRLYLSEGYTSLFAYCTRGLHLSERAAYARIQAARLARRLPFVLERLADGAVNLTTVSLLGPHLTVENHAQLLEEAAHKGKFAVEEIVARIRPATDTPEFVRKLPNSHSHVGAVFSGQPPAGIAPASTSFPGMSRIPEVKPGLEQQASKAACVSGEKSTPGPSPAAPQHPPLARAVIAPIAPQRYRIQITAGAGTFMKLQRAQDLLRHQVPDGNPTVVIDRALTVLVSDLERRRFAAVSRPVTGRPQPRKDGAPPVWTRHIPADVRREVWQRDGGRCAYVHHDGKRCELRGWLEFHHLKPHAWGGRPVPENLELRCRAHNQYEADLVFGKAD